MTILMDADNLGETIKTAMDGNMSFVFQVDVDLACEETFYVTDAKTGEVRGGVCSGASLLRLYISWTWQRRLYATDISFCELGQVM